MDVTLSKEPLGPAVPLGDDQWFNVVKWTIYSVIQAEESGITSKNVDQMVKSADPVIKRLLSDKDLAAGLGLNPDWVVKVVKAVGNYGEMYDRKPGTEHAAQIATWSEQTLDARRIALRAAVSVRLLTPTLPSP